MWVCIQKTARAQPPATVQQHFAPRQAYNYPADELEAGQALMPRSAYRYRPIDALKEMIKRGDARKMDNGIMYVDREGNAQYYTHNGPPPIPARASAEARTTGQRDTDEQPLVQQPIIKRPRRRFHWLFFVGIAFMVAILGYVGFGALGTWWQNHQNDAAYGYPRTFQIDAVVGHNGDSQANPSHFIAENLRGHIIIIELPAGDISHALIYSAGPVLTGNRPDLIPVTLSFQDEPGSKGPAMIVNIEGSTMVWLNNGTKFVAPSNVGG